MNEMTISYSILCLKNVPPHCDNNFVNINYFQNSFTAGKCVKFPTKQYITYPPHLKSVVALTQYLWHLNYRMSFQF